MTEREAFEAWMRDAYGPGVNLERSQDGYISTVPHRCLWGTYASVQMLWDAWRARAQPAQAEAVLSDAELAKALRPCFEYAVQVEEAMLTTIDEYRAVEQAVRAKLGVAVPSNVVCDKDPQRC